MDNCEMNNCEIDVILGQLDAIFLDYRYRQVKVCFNKQKIIYNFTEYKEGDLTFDYQSGNFILSAKIYGEIIVLNSKQSMQCIGTLHHSLTQQVLQENDRL